MQLQNVSGGYGSPAIMLQNVAIKQTVTKAWPSDAPSLSVALSPTRSVTKYEMWSEKKSEEQKTSAVNVVVSALSLHKSRPVSLPPGLSSAL